MKIESPIYRFEKFDKNWLFVKISDLASQFKTGGTPSTKEPTFWGGSIPWIQSSDIQKDILFGVIPQKFISEEGLQNSSAKLIPKNSIAIVTRVGVGKLAIIDQDYATSQDFLSLSDFDGDILFIVYSIYRMLQKESTQLQGTSIKGITKEDLLSKKICLPEIDEQSAVGSLFRTVDDLLASYKDNLANYQSLKATMLSKMFPKAGRTVPEIRLDGFEGEWKLYELKSRAETITKGTTPKDKSWQGEVNYIKTESINRDTGSLVRTASTSLEEHLGYLKRSILKEGDVLFSIVGTLGVVGIVDKKDLPANTNQQIAIIRLRRDDAIFMLNFLKSPRIKSFIKSDSTIGAQPSLSLWQIEKTKVSLPPSLEEQQAVGAYFSNLDNLINSHQEKISQLETLKKKLLQDMFI